MNINSGTEITSSHLREFYNEIDTICETINDSSYLSYGKSNTLYNHSSVVEDILTANMTALYGKLNSITYSYTNSKVVFIEPFQSLEYIDKKFHVDKALNIDTSNRSLTLAIKDTKVNEIVSVIIEPDSNGTPGNAINSFSNGDIKAILDDDLSSVFEYEKYTSIYDSGSLTLVLTLKTIKMVIANSIYVKMYNQSSIKYPSIDKIEVSVDGAVWKEIRGFVQSFTEQNDFYIRFGAERVRFLRLKLSQNVAEYTETGFGIKNRYSIALRGVQIITNEFADTGSYVSIPLSTGSPISNVSLTSEYISENGLDFSISANNGGTWLKISPDGTPINLPNSKTGVMLVENLKSVRVRIGMARAIGSALQSTSEQLFNNLSANFIYSLKGLPIKILALIGGHISCGGENRYTPQIPFISNILDILYKNSGLTIITEDDLSTSIRFLGDGSSVTTENIITYKIPGEYTVFESPIDGSKIISVIASGGSEALWQEPSGGGTRTFLSVSPSGGMIITPTEVYDSNSLMVNKPDLSDALDAVREYVSINSETTYTFKARYVPYYSGIENDLSLFVGNQNIPSILDDNGARKVLWLAVPDYNNMHTVIYLDLINLELMYKVGADTFINGTIPSHIQLQFNKQFYNPLDSGTGNIITLKHRLLTSNKSDIVITEFINGKISGQLTSDQFSIVDDSWKKLKIELAAFSSNSTYVISYIPGFDISHLLPSITSNELEIKSISDAPFTSKVSFLYTYEDLNNAFDTKYYSPICKNYKIELS